jgi:hypothetical protein
MVLLTILLLLLVKYWEKKPVASAGIRPFNLLDVVLGIGALVLIRFLDPGWSSFVSRWLPSAQASATAHTTALDAVPAGLELLVGISAGVSEELLPEVS